MNLPYPHFDVNFEVYPGTYGEEGRALAELIERVGGETGAEFVLIPQLPDVRMVAEATDLPVVAPYADALEPGRGMGRVLPEAVAAAGAEGVVVNHAENPGSLLRAIGREVAAAGDG